MRFQLADEQESADVAAKLKATLSSLGPEGSETELVKALVYETRRCYGNAFLAYEAAARLDSSEAMRILFRRFLIEQLQLRSFLAEEIVDRLSK